MRHTRGRHEALTSTCRIFKLVPYRDLNLTICTCNLLLQGRCIVQNTCLLPSGHLTSGGFWPPNALCDVSSCAKISKRTRTVQLQRRRAAASSMSWCWRLLSATCILRVVRPTATCALLPNLQGPGFRFRRSMARSQSIDQSINQASELSLSRPSHYLPIRLSVFFSIYPSIYLPTYVLTSYLTLQLCSYPDIHLSIELSTYLSIRLSTHFMVDLSTYLSNYLTAYLSVYLTLLYPTLPPTLP